MSVFTAADIEKMVRTLAEKAIANEVYFCELDSVAGDGDFGMSLAKGFRILIQEWETLDHSGDIGAFLKDCGMLITEHCGGASGPIWGSAFRAAARYAKEKTDLSAQEFAGMMQSAVQGIQKRGGARLGDKTLLDALIPAVEAIEQCAAQEEDVSTLLKAGAQAAVQGAERTKEIVATKGRASYLGERSLSHPDAGAMAIGVLFTDIANQWPG